LHIAYLSGAYLRGTKLTGTDLQWTNTWRTRAIDRITTNVHDVAVVRIQVNEEPLTGSNLAIIISSLTELYTKCWLIQQDRFEDLIEYIQTHDTRLIEEADLIINKITKQSPALIDFLIGPAGVAGAGALALALGKAIDSIAQIPLRFKEKQLANREKELVNREKELELEKKYIKYKIEAAKEILEFVKPDMNDTFRSEFAQTILTDLLKSDKSFGVTLALPPPKDNKKSDAIGN
jgi:hypothetical protein